jgi:subtilisin family serine protease
MRLPSQCGRSIRRNLFMKTRLLVVLAFLLLSIGSVSSNISAPAQNQKAALDKIAPWVFGRTSDGQQAEFLIVMSDQADLRGAEAFATKEEKGQFVYKTLWAKAQATQGPILDWLKENKIEHRSYYIVNMVWVKGNRDVALALASRADVARVEGNPVINNFIEPEPSTQNPSSPETIQGGVTNTRAPEVWSMGFTGQGVVVGGADTGYRWDHTAIKNKYRGFDGVTANHNYSWHDSIHSGGGSCGPNSPQPCDDNGHGTHTMGTVVGDDGGINQVGMAPGARWIGCRNMDQGNGTPATYIECFEFFLAPYPVGGTPSQGDPTKAPDVTTNSWGCPPSEGCSALTLQSAVEAQRAAGIMTVVAAGNSGSSCSTVSDPPAIYDAAYTVGAFDHRTNVVASFSSRGPVTLDGSNRRKPDISAPGVGITSSTRTSTTSYGSLSGTSMATPHVAGAVALLWSAQPSLRHQIAATEDTLNGASVPVSVTACSATGSPNNTYGWGRLDIKFAVDFSLSTTLSPSSKYLQTGGEDGQVVVNAPAGARWTAVSNAGWITIVSDTSGTGSGSIAYLVRANATGSARQGTITVAGKTFTIVQDGGINENCTYNIAPLSASYTKNGGSGTINMTVESRCSWQAVPSAGWITITSNCCGAGNGTVSYSIAPNLSGLSRSGTISLGGKVFTIKQKAQ